MSLGRGTSILLASRIVGYVLAVINSVIVARALGADGLGEYAYAAGIAGVFGLLPNLGISTIVTRTIAQSVEPQLGVMSAAWRAQAILAGLFLLVVPAFGAMLPEQPVPLLYIVLAAAQTAVGTLSWPYLAVLAGRVKYHLVALGELTTGVVTTVALLGVGLSGGGVRTFLWIHVLIAAVAVMVARWVALPYLPSKSPSSMSIRTLIRQAAPFGLIAVMQSLYMRIDVLLLGQMATTTAVGLYNVAYKPTTLVVHIGATVAGTLFPIMAQSREHGAPLSFYRGLHLLSVGGSAVALLVSGLSPSLIQVLYGTEFIAATPVLIVLAWSTAANWLYQPLAIALQARGHERSWLFSLSAAFVCNAVGNLWAIPRWGATGAAGATLGSELLLLGLAVVGVHRAFGIVPSTAGVGVQLVATLSGASTLWLVYEFGALFATACALAVYMAVLVQFRVITWNDATLLGGWVRQSMAPIEPQLNAGGDR